MTRRYRSAVAWSVAALLLLSLESCHKQTVIPERLEKQVDRDLRYVEVKDAPDRYRGKLMLAGGKVLSAKRLSEGTRIEVLQMPLSEDLIPDGRETDSKGRFVAMDFGNKHVVDPAVLEDGKIVTLVGEVLGTTTTTIDEVQSQVPELALKHVTVWDRDELRNAYRPYDGYYPPYAWGYGPKYGYPYYW